MAVSDALDLLTFGRVGIDLYPLVDGVPLEHVELFGRFLGGSPTNVAVAGARLGLRTAVITRTGDDPFSVFVREELCRLGVDDRFVGVAAGIRTTIAFCEIYPPDRFPLYFFRAPVPPELTIAPEDLDLAAIADARIFWTTLSGLAMEPSRAAHLAAWEARGGRRGNVIDLDHRPAYWESPEAAAAQGRIALGHVAVAVGNLAECELVVGESDPDSAADALLDAGVELAVVKLGPEGVLAATPTERIRAAPIAVPVVNGLGAGDGFGGALCRGLLAGESLTTTLDFANAAGAIVASRRECATAMPTASEVASMLRGVLPARPDES